MTNKYSRLVLGTAQLGMPYGIANISGQPDVGRATAIVAAAWSNGVRYFDTAQAYGSSETVLGEVLQSLGFCDSARIITKLAPTLDINDPNAILAALHNSLERLGATQLWGVLLHREQQLDYWGGALGQTLLRAKKDGLVAHTGVSVYSQQRALQAIQLDGLDALQVPANVFDRRMKRAGVFQQAQARGVQIFIRSAYLQGLALLPLARVAQMAPFAVSAVEALDQFCQSQRLKRNEFALRYALALDEPSLVVVGAEMPVQIVANCCVAASPDLPPILVKSWDAVWSEDIELLINPSLWPKALTT